MAAQANLNVVLSGDAKQLTKEMKAAEENVSKLQKELNKTSNTKPFVQLPAQVAKVTSEVNKLNSAVSKNALPKLGKASVDATGDLINLGRVIQDAPFGILGIANNLNPLAEGFARTKNAAGGFGGAMAALGKSLTGAGGLSLAISVISTGLLVFGDRLFKSSTKTDDFSLSLERLSRQARDTKKDLDAFISSSDFLLARDTRLLDLAIPSGFDRDLSKSNTELTALKDNLRQTKAAIDEMKASSTSAFKEFQSVLSDGTRNAIANVVDLRDTPQGVIENMTKREKRAFDTYVGILNDLSSLWKKEVELSNQVDLKKLDTKVIITEDERKRLEKAKKDYEDYVNSTISKAKELASFMDKHSIRAFNFEVDPRDSIEKTFERAKDFINRASTSEGVLTFRFKIGFHFNIDFDKLKTEFDKARAKFFEQLPKLIEAQRKEMEKEIAAMTARNPILLYVKTQMAKAKANDDLMKSITENIQLDGVQALTSAFEDLFSAIAQGKNPVSAFFQTLANSIGQLIARLAAAAAVAAILNALLGGAGFMGATGFKEIFAKVAGFRADGGPVSAGKSYVVGERGPEIFRPSVGGTIIPNDVSARGGVAVSAGSGQTVRVQGIISGRDLRLVNARQAGYENRNA